MLNGHRNSHGLDLIKKYAHGEALTEGEIQAMRSTMYLITCYLEPQREWADFHWRGPDHFMEEYWPQIRERQGLLTGQFGHGAIRP